MVHCPYSNVWIQPAETEVHRGLGGLTEILRRENRRDGAKERPTGGGTEERRDAGEKGRRRGGTEERRDEALQGCNKRNPEGQKYYPRFSSLPQ